MSEPINGAVERLAKDIAFLENHNLLSDIDWDARDAYRHYAKKFIKLGYVHIDDVRLCEYCQGHGQVGRETDTCVNCQGRGVTIKGRI